MFGIFKGKEKIVERNIKTKDGEEVDAGAYFLDEADRSDNAYDAETIFNMGEQFNEDDLKNFDKDRRRLKRKKK